MKLWVIPLALVVFGPAAFRRLCVETLRAVIALKIFSPAAFRRLCVETWPHHYQLAQLERPAAFRRLCVETVPYKNI